MVEVQRVCQKSKIDCMVAALAMYCRVGYMDVWNAMTPGERNVMRQGVGLAPWPTYRIAYDLKGVRLVCFSLREILPIPCILTYTDEYPGGHAVYWDGKEIYNPSSKPLKGELTSVECDLRDLAPDLKNFDWKRYMSSLATMYTVPSIYRLGARFAEGLPS